MLWLVRRGKNKSQGRPEKRWRGARKEMEENIWQPHGPWSASLVIIYKPCASIYSITKNKGL